MSETEQQFLDARQAFRDHLRGHNKSIADAFTEIALASEQQSQHRVNLDNPHGMTKADIGLGLVENRAPATEQDIIDLVNLGRMMTPATLKQLIQDPRMTEGASQNSVRTPKSLSPVSDAVVISTLSVTMVADAYRNMYSRNIDGEVMRIPRDRREFELYDAAVEMNTPIWTGDINADQITAAITLARTAAYRWRCRDVSIDGEFSLWSALAQFIAPASQIITPTLTFQGGINSVVKNPLISTGAFATEGDADVHVTTTWRLFYMDASTPAWEVVSSTELEEIRIPGNYLFAQTSYQMEVIHTTQGAGEATSGRVTFTTMPRFPFVPGPVELYWGDETTGYYGEIPQSSFISGERLFLETGLSAGQSSPWALTTTWIKIHLDGRVAYVPRYPLRYGVSEDDLKAMGLMGNGKEITLNNTIYRVRSLFGLMPGIVADDYSRLGDTPNNDPTLTADSEWSRVMPMILTLLDVASNQAELGLTNTYRHNQAAEENLGTSGASVVRGQGATAAADSVALTYVSEITHAAIQTTPQSVSWRPVVIVQSVIA